MAGFGNRRFRAPGEKQWQREGLDDYGTDQHERTDRRRTTNGLYVAIYTHSCLAGASSIWSLEVDNGEKRSKVFTIEVNLASGTICQVRGIAMPCL